MTSVMTGCLDKVDRVRGLTKAVAEGVMSTFTLAPDLMSSLVRVAALYAAMLPLTARMIFFPFTGLCVADGLYAYE